MSDGGCGVGGGEGVKVGEWRKEGEGEVGGGPCSAYPVVRCIA